MVNCVGISRNLGRYIGSATLFDGSIPKARTDEQRLLIASCRSRKDFSKACSMVSPSASSVFSFVTQMNGRFALSASIDTLHNFVDAAQGDTFETEDNKRRKHGRQTLIRFQIYKHKRQSIRNAQILRNFPRPDSTPDCM